MTRKRNREYDKAYRASHLKEHHDAYKRYCEKYPERVKATAQKYRETHKEAIAERRKARKDKEDEYNAAYRLKNKELMKVKRVLGKEAKAEYDRKYREKNQDKFYSKYGLTISAYYSILESQNKSCAICKTTDMSRYTKFFVDHDHSTGDVRGLLCNKCNYGLGAMSDSVQKIKMAISYLSRPLVERFQYNKQTRRPISEASWQARRNAVLPIILAEQGDCCAICAKASCGRGRNGYHVDHDHKTGIIRGALCASCNKGIGIFQDSVDVLTSAAKYLCTIKERMTPHKHLFIEKTT